jgi:hypothetical protein
MEEEIIIQIPIQTTTICNLEIFQGAEVKNISGNPKTNTAEYRYLGRKLGEETIRWEGAMKFRGLKTQAPCPGSGVIKIETIPNEEMIKSAIQAKQLEILKEEKEKEAAEKILREKIRVELIEEQTKREAEKAALERENAEKIRISNELKKQDDERKRLAELAKKLKAQEDELAVKLEIANKAAEKAAAVAASNTTEGESKASNLQKDYPPTEKIAAEKAEAEKAAAEKAAAEKSLILDTLKKIF